MRSSTNDVLKNKEIITLIQALGTGIGEQFQIKKLKYDKVIIMTDADYDGAHIQILLLTFFYFYMRNLFFAHKIYLALAPLYKVMFSNQDYQYAWNEIELKAIVTAKQKKYTIQRYKGLGEMNASQLWATTMNPEKRRLVQVNIINPEETQKRFEDLMGKNSSLRKAWINENVSFANKTEHWEKIIGETIAQDETKVKKDQL